MERDGEYTFLLLCNSFLDVVDAGLGKGVSDSGLSALALAGCGTHLTVLSLEGDRCSCFVGCSLHICVVHACFFSGVIPNSMYCGRRFEGRSD